MRDLGILVDPKLSFTSHCQYIAKKASMRINAIFRSFQTRETSFLIDMYKIFVRPILEYATTCWSPFLAKDVRLIESVQRTFTRRIPALSGQNLSYLERLEKLQLERLDLRRLKADLLMAYRILHGYMDVDANSILKFHQQAYASYGGLQISGTRLRLSKPPAHLNSRKNYFGIRVVKYWNLIPEHIRLAKNVSVFKRYLNSEPIDAILTNLLMEIN